MPSVRPSVFNQRVRSSRCVPQSRQSGKGPVAAAVRGQCSKRL